MSISVGLDWFLQSSRDPVLRCKFCKIVAWLYRFIFLLFNSRSRWLCMVCWRCNSLAKLLPSGVVVSFLGEHMFLIEIHYIAAILTMLFLQGFVHRPQLSRVGLVLEM